MNNCILNNLFKKCSILFFLLFFAFPLIAKVSSRYAFKIEIYRIEQHFSSEVNFKKAHYYYLKGDWDSTLVYCMRQLNSPNKNILLHDYCHVMRGMGLINKGLYLEAQKEFSFVSKSFPFRNKIKIAKGIIALKQNNFSKALIFFEGVQEKKSYYFYIDKSSFYHNIGLCYFHTKQFNKAEKYLLKGVNLQLAEKDTLEMTISYMDLANLYYEQYKDQKAIPYFEKAYRLSKKTNNFELRKNAALNMAVVEENRKNLPRALAYRKEFEQWKDSLNDQNKVWAVAETEKKYAITQKQKEINLLEAENKLKIAERNGFLITAVLLLLLFGAGIYFYRQKIKQNAVIAAQKERLDQLNAAKDQLFSIVSHDLRSSVNALKTSNGKLLDSLASKNYSQLDSLLHANSSIANGTYNLLDNLLNWAMLQTRQHYFHQEPHRLSAIAQQVAYNYAPLMEEKNIRFESTVPPDVFVHVDLDSVKIILRNVLDNAIKFSKENDTIRMYVQHRETPFCDLVVEDTGAGMPADVRDGLLGTAFSIPGSHRESTGTGLGMQLCKSLVAKNGGHLAIESHLGLGTKIIVSLPVNP